MKKCSKCGETKPGEAFFKDATRKSGLNSHCKTCVAARSAAYYKRNSEKLLAKQAEYREQNRERESARIILYRKENPEKIAASTATWRKKNSEKIAASSANRRAIKMQRTLPLFPDGQKAINHLYAFCKFISQKTGISHHVDHIVPLQGKEMSGLHVPWNLRIVPAAQNIAKLNKVDLSLAIPTCFETK